MAIEGDVDSDEGDVTSSGEDSSVGSEIDIAGVSVSGYKRWTSAVEIPTRQEDHDRVVGQFCNLVADL